jgi:hypothetical protein
LDIEASRVEISEGVEPRRVSFNLGEERIGARGVGGKGGRRRPGLGAMRSFWWEGGMRRDVDM